MLAAFGAAVILLASSGTDHWTHRPRVMGSREWLTMVARRLGAGWPAVVAMLLNLMVALGAFALVALG